MPCDSIITNSVDMPKMHPDLLNRALKALGVENVSTYGQQTSFTYKGQRYTLTRGELRGNSGQSEQEVGRVANLLKNAYGHQVVKATAAKNNWTIKQTAAHAYVVQRR